MAKLTHLEQIAAENAVYMQKMRQRFRHSNIVGVESTIGQPSPYLLCCRLMCRKERTAKAKGAGSTSFLSTAYAYDYDDYDYNYNYDYDYDDDYYYEEEDVHINSQPVNPTVNPNTNHQVKLEKTKKEDGFDDDYDDYYGDDYDDDYDDNYDYNDYDDYDYDFDDGNDNGDVGDDVVDEGYEDDYEYYENEEDCSPKPVNPALSNETKQSSNPINQPNSGSEFYEYDDYDYSEGDDWEEGDEQVVHLPPRVQVVVESSDKSDEEW